MEARYLQSPVQARRSSYYWYKIHVSISSPHSPTHTQRQPRLDCFYLFVLFGPTSHFSKPRRLRAVCRNSPGLSFLPAAFPTSPAWRHLLPLYFIPPFPCGGPLMPRGLLPAKPQGLLDSLGPQGPSREGGQGRTCWAPARALNIQVSASGSEWLFLRL